jgi:hypothetical protein
MLFPVKLKIFLMAFSPLKRAVPAGLLPGRILRLLVLEIMRILPPPRLHVLQLPLVLAFQRRAYRLVRAVFIRRERFSAYPAHPFFGHIFSPFLFLRVKEDLTYRQR